LIVLNESAVGTQAPSEEENKWTKLNLALITNTIDQSPECVHLIAEMFSELENIDHKRKGYYADQRSRLLIESKLKSGKLNTSSICLSNNRLSSIYYQQYFCLVQELDLSSNRITSIDGLLPYLVECHTLILDNNCIEEISYIEEETKCNHKVVGGQKLKVLSLKKNPIGEDENVISKIKESWLHGIVIF